MSRISLAAREPLLLGAPASVLATIGAALALVLGLAVLALDHDQVVRPPVEVAALVALAGACAVVALRADPFRAPFRRRWHAVVLGLVLVGSVLDQLAQLGGEVAVHDDWGLAVLPVFLLVHAILRPAREVLVGGLAAVLVAAAAALALALAEPGVSVPARVRVAIVLTQLLPPAVAAAALARVTMRRLDAPATRPAAPTPDAAIPAVRQEAVAQLEAAAIPLLTAVADAGAVTAEQAERAREIAAELRAALVAGLARGWLADAGFAVDDPDGYAERLTAEQRTALRTTVASLPLADAGRPGTASVHGQDRSAVLVLAVAVADRPRRSRVAPLVALLRSVFPRADLRMADDRVQLVVEFGVAR